MTIIPALAPGFTPRSTFNNGNPEFHPAPSIKTVWQHAVAQADLPFHTKGILLIVATEWMDADGGSCFPTEEQIMAKAGISRPCLTRHLRIAVDNGFIERWHWGHGNGNRRYNYRAIIPGQPAPPIPEMGNVVSYPTGEMGNVVSFHKPCPIINQFQKTESAAIPEPYRPEPAAASVPPTGAPSGFVIQTKTVLPEDWQLPADFRQWAEQHRPDLAGQMDSIASKFHDFHLSKATRSACWIAEWRRWINRERAVKPHQTASTAPQAVHRYAHLDQPQQPVSAAVKAALAISEQNRIAMLIQSGIDPATGFPIATTTPSTTSTVSNPNPSINDQADQSYAARLAALEARIAARKEREGGPCT